MTNFDASVPLWHGRKSGSGAMVDHIDLVIRIRVAQSLSFFVGLKVS